MKKNYSTGSNDMYLDHDNLQQKEMPKKYELRIFVFYLSWDAI